jgi:hypothetical protein
MPDMKWQAGLYKCICDGHTWKVANGTDVLEILIRPNEGLEGQQCHSEQYPRKITVWWDDKVERTFDHMIECKLVETPDIDDWNFTGKEVVARCKYNAKGYDQWYFEMAGSQGEDPEAPKRVAKKFGTLLKKKFQPKVKTVDDLPKDIPF